VARTRYVALVRGINVGGRNKVPMADLRAAVEDAGHTDVATYIQSGNVVFSSTRPRAEVEADLESVLEHRFGFPLVVVVRSHAQLRAIVHKAPRGFGKTPDEYHSDVIFVRSPLTPAKAMKVVQLRDEVDQAWSGAGVLYFARLSSRRTQSKLSKIVGTPEYALMTIRNWATTTKLLAMLDDGAA
jgi:uncharacterized protein (DUF1697 family)